MFRRVLQSPQQAQREVEALIASWEREHPQYERVLRLWRTIAGVGRWTALVLLAETGGYTASAVVVRWRVTRV